MGLLSNDRVIRCHSSGSLVDIRDDEAWKIFKTRAINTKDYGGRWPKDVLELLIHSLTNEIGLTL